MQETGNKTQEPVVRVRDLKFAHGDRVVFDGVDLDIMPGCVTAIMGPSGSGKTTLLKLIGGQLRPQSGSIHVYGEQVSALNRRALYRLRR
ncbi:MAG: ATP-binding cassette domain-containing protein, partial [Gammaproteobacteria bacterium]|nr:ATP-binding cassette domain-containing protein [Gammaproteobacteria bacterium]